MGQHVTFKKNALQLIYGISNIHEYLDKYLLEVMLNLTCHKIGITENFKIMKKPCLTRWWTVGVALTNLTKSWDIWKNILAHIINIGTVAIPSAILAIAKSSLELIQSN